MVTLGAIAVPAMVGLTLASPVPAAPLSASVTVATVVQDTANAAMVQAIHTQINAYRQRQGLPPLRLHAAISAQAQQHSQDMASGRVPFSHDGFQQRVQAIRREVSYRSAAENVAFNFGHRDPAGQAVEGWLKSAGHHKNIVGNYDLTGIGVAQNGRRFYFTQIFIRQR